MKTLEEKYQDAVDFQNQGKIEDAEKNYRDILRQNPYHLGALCNLGSILSLQKKFEEALGNYQKALQLNPEYMEAIFNMGNTYRQMGRFAEGIGCYQTVLRKAPNFAPAHHNMGLILFLLGKFDQGIEAQKQALFFDPGLVEAYLLIAESYTAMGQQDRSIQTYLDFIKARPKDPRGYHNLGLTLARIGKIDEALESVAQALNCNPDYPEAHNTYGVLLENKNRSEEALSHYARAVQLKPDFADALNNLGSSLLEMGEQQGAVEYRLKSLELQPGAAHIFSNYLLSLHYLPGVDPLFRFAEHRNWAIRYADQLAPPIPPTITSPDPNRKLKIGYLSSDFREHTVASFLEPLLKNHQHNDFHITAVSNVLNPDDRTEKLKSYTDDFLSIAGLDNERAYELIREKEIDILVDCNGHTAGNRLLLLARQPAPIQMTVFGYPNTTGLRTVQYRISDVYSDPPEVANLYQESLLLFPEMAWCYQVPALDIPVYSEEPRKNPATIHFGSLNNLAKVSLQLIVLWASLLKQVPGSKLFLLLGRGGLGRNRVIDFFHQLGITEDRLVLTSRLPAEDYYRLHQQIDIYLDPIPYNGGVTTADALWMGVPVVTCEGDMYYSRQGGCMLRQIGMESLIARVPQETVTIAARLAKDPVKLREMKADIRERFLKSPIVDAKRYVEHLESVYRTVWRETLQKIASQTDPNVSNSSSN